jgi:hypothetical protein
MANTRRQDGGSGGGCGDGDDEHGGKEGDRVTAGSRQGWKQMGSIAQPHTHSPTIINARTHLDFGVLLVVAKAFLHPVRVKRQHSDTLALG